MLPKELIRLASRARSAGGNCGLAANCAASAAEACSRLTPARIYVLSRLYAARITGVSLALVFGDLVGQPCTDVDQFLAADPSVVSLWQGQQLADVRFAGGQRGVGLSARRLSSAAQFGAECISVPRSFAESRDPQHVGVHERRNSSPSPHSPATRGNDRTGSTRSRRKGRCRCSGISRVKETWNRLWSYALGFATARL